MAQEHEEQKKLGSRRSQARESRRRRAGRKKGRRNFLYALGGGAVAVLLVVSLFLPSVNIFGRSSSSDDTPDNQELVGTFVPLLGRDHVTDGTVILYNSTPPTSGSHYGTPGLWGVHEAQLPDGQVVHNLEHGGVSINHNLTDPDQLAALQAFVEGQSGFPGCFVMQSHAQVPAGSVTITAWQWLQQFDGVHSEGMQAFIDAHVNRGPESFGPGCGNTGTVVR